MVPLYYLGTVINFLKSVCDQSKRNFFSSIFNLVESLDVETKNAEGRLYAFMKWCEFPSGYLPDPA